MKPGGSRDFQAHSKPMVIKAKSVKVVAGGLALLVGLLLAVSPLGTALDNLAYDLNYLFSSSQEPTSEVLIVAIDEASFQELSQPWPWPRSLHARLLNSLFEGGAKAVVLDIILADPTKDDPALASALQAFGPVILATDEERRKNGQFERIISVQPRPEFQTENVRLGSARIPVDADGFVRRLGQAGMRGEPSLAHAAALAFKPQMSPSKEGKDQLINFSGAAGHLPQISYYQALDPNSYLANDAIRDKLVFVGLVTQSDVLDQTVARDSYPTPHTPWGGGYMNGVEIHAQAAQSLLADSVITPVAGSLILLMSVLLAAAALWGMFWFNPLRAALPALAIILFIVLLTYWVCQNHQIYISWPILLLPALMISIVSPLIHYMAAWQERNFIHKAFSSYVAEPVVKQLMDNPQLLQTGGSLKEGSVLFLDLRGFTAASEKMSPETVLAMLNKHLGALSEIALDEGGLVDKFMGDNIMVVWGTPLPDDNHASRACRAALKMQGYLAQQRDSGDAMQQLSARIGIHSGEFVAGNIGGARRFDYTVIGDTVNLAARLEAANTEFGTEILISETTQQTLEPKEFATRRIDSIQVRGRAQSVVVYELLRAPA